MNTFTSPSSSPTSSRGGITVVRLSQGQIPQYQARESFESVVKERNELESFIGCLAKSQKEAQGKLGSYSPLKIEVKDQLKGINEKLVLLDDYNGLVNHIANKWEDLIDVNFTPKTEQMQIIVTMTNELKMLVKILTQNRNAEDFQNSRFSPYCTNFFNAAVDAKNNSQLLMRIAEDIRLDLLLMKNQGKITEELYSGVVKSQPMHLFKEWRMLTQHILKQEGPINSPKESNRIRAGGFDNFNFNRESTQVSRLQQEKQSLLEKNNQQEAAILVLKKKNEELEVQYNRMADELYKQKVNEQRREYVENNQSKIQQLAAQQSTRQSLEAALQSSKQEISNLQLRLNQSDTSYSHLLSRMQANQSMWLQQRQKLIRDLQVRNSQLVQLTRDQQNLQRSKDQLVKEKNHLQYLLNQKSELLDMESQKVAALNLMINQSEQAKRRLQQELAKERGAKIKEVQQKMGELRLQNSLLSTQLTESKSSIERLISQNSNLSKERQEMIQEKKRLSSALKSQQSSTTMPTSPRKIEQLTRTINDLNLTIKRLQTRVKNKDQQIEDYSQQVESLNKMMQDRDQLSDSRTGNTDLLLQYQEKIKTMERRIAELQRSTEVQADLSSKLKEAVKIKNQELLALENLLKQSEQKTSNLKKYTIIISDLRQENAQLTQALQQFHQKMKKLQTGLDGSSMSRINCLFQNDILDNEPQHKRYLTEVIQTYMRIKILKTRLIYAFDPNNKTNFHKYIDGKDNLVFIIRMLNGTYTAAYSQGIFQPRQVSDRQGLIIALSRQMYFTLNQPNHRAITYDDYYIIFGNSEIRLRSQQKKLFSNFSIANSYYRSQGEKVNVLLGGTPQQRELELDHYEVYQLAFDV